MNADNMNQEGPNGRSSTLASTPTSSSWSSLRTKVAVIAGDGHRRRTASMDLGESIHSFHGATEEDAFTVIRMLQKNGLFDVLPEKSKRMLLQEVDDKREGRVTVLEELTKRNKGEELDNDDTNIEDQKQRQLEDEENRLGFLWRQRSKRKNWTLLTLFHITVLLNFAICIFASYQIIIEHAKFDKLAADDDFNCISVIASGDSVNHFFNIFHGFMCVAVIYADRSSSSNVLWAFVVTQISHAANNIFQLLYNFRFPGHSTEEIIKLSFSFAIITLVQILGTLVVIQRYYDMSGALVKRKHRYTAAVFSGRLLNEQIIYQNESNFLQKKYTLRQATALEIYGVVQKLEHFKQLGVHQDPEKLNPDIETGIKALREVESYEGPDMLKKLRKRNAKKLMELKLAAKTGSKEVTGAVSEETKEAKFSTDSIINMQSGNF